MLTSLEQKLAELVALRSTPDNVPACREIIARFRGCAEAYGLHVREWSDGGLPILLATTRPTLQPKLLIVMHTDVVDASEGQFTMHSDRERLYGRGVWDMKYAIAASMELLETIGPRVSEYDAGFLLTSDEETRNHNVAYAFEQGVSAACAVIPDGGEDWQLEAAAKGVWCTTATVMGVASHGSRPWEGESASFALHTMLAEIMLLFDGQGPYTDTLNISRLHAGKAHNQLPDLASATLDVRAMNTATMTEKQSAITKIYDRYKASWEVEVYMQPLVHNLENAFLQAFDDSARTETHLPSAPVLSHGGSDASDFMKRDVPCIVTRPKGGAHHAEGEWIDRESLALFVPIMKRFLDQAARVPGGAAKNN